MRTTIELSEGQRSRLRALTARRGEKGYSALIQEAVERYLEEAERRRELAEEARAAIGALDDEEVRSLEASVERLRDRWR